MVRGPIISRALGTPIVPHGSGTGNDQVKQIVITTWLITSINEGMVHVRGGSMSQGCAELYNYKVVSKQ